MKLKSNTHPPKSLKPNLVNYIKKQNNPAKNDIAIYYPQGMSIVCDFSLSKTAILSHLLFLSDKGRRSDGYFYKSQRELADEIGCSRWTIIRAIDWFIECGILKTKIKKANGVTTTHFKFDKCNLFAFCRKKIKENKLK